MTVPISTHGQPPRLVRTADRPRASRRRVALLLVSAVAVVGAWWFVLAQATGPIPGPATIVSRSATFIGNLLGASVTGTPAYLEAASWARLATLVVDTLTMSVLAMAIAGAGVLATVGFASRLLTTGELGPRRRGVGLAVLLVARGAHAVFRAVPELIWAMLIVFVLRPGILAGALALAVHEFGVLGRLGSDVVDDLDTRPLRALRSTGASSGQLLLYGALPQVLPQFVTFLLYRWEIVIRATVVVGFVTGAGLGHQLRLDLSFRRWTSVALLLAAYVVLVWVVELIAAGLRRLAR